MSGLTTLDVALWIAVAVGQALLAIVIHRAKTESSYPAFSIFVYFAALKTLVLMFLLSRGLRFYVRSYYAVSVISLLLMALVAAEIYDRVFGPRLALPKGTPRNVALWLMAAVASCAILAIALRPSHGGLYIRIMGVTQSALISGLCVSLWILAAYSRWLGISWRPHIAGIAAGIILCLSVNTITFFVGGVSSRPTAEAARRVGQLAYLLSLVWWGWVLWEKEPVPEKATPEMIRAVLSNHQETMEAANQVFEKLRS